MAKYIDIDAIFWNGKRGEYTTRIFWDLAADDSIRFILDHETGEIVYSHSDGYFARHWFAEHFPRFLPSWEVA